MVSDVDGTNSLDIVADNGHGIRITSSTAGFCFPSIVLSLAKPNPLKSLDDLEAELHCESNKGGLLAGTSSGGGVLNTKCCRLIRDLGMSYASAADFYD